MRAKVRVGREHGPIPVRPPPTPSGLFFTQEVKSLLSFEERFEGHPNGATGDSRTWTSGVWGSVRRS
jgi:hypothetical protein